MHEVMSTSTQPLNGYASRSAAGLLLTVLGEFVLPAATEGVWTGVLVAVLGDLGVEEKATRQVLMRTAARGLITSERHGRRARWLLTDAGRALLTEGTRRIYAPAASRPGWCGQWLVVLARAPEADRGARHHLQSRLGWAGLGKLAPGTWISPHPERYDEVHSVLSESELAADAHVFVGRLRDAGRPADLVASAWDLSAIEDYYGWFVGEFRARAPRTPEATLSRQVELIHYWRRSLLIDPALPRELLPRVWPGDQAEALFRRRHEQWRAAAWQRWRSLVAAA